MLVLASSQKLGGRCVAGLGLDSGALVRPVSPTETGALSLADCRVDGDWPKLRHVVAFGHRGHDGRPWQPENLELDGSAWTRLPALSGAEIDTLLEGRLHTDRALLGNRGAAVPVEECADGADASLALVAPSEIRFEHEQVSWGSGSRPRVWFRHRGRRWKLPVTDFTLRPLLLRRPFGVYDWDDLELDARRRVILTVSLGEPHEGWHYKLVAAVVRLP
jgi:hypothetical protein